MSSPTEYATRLTSFTTSAFSNWTLNSAGLAFISKTGLTRFGMRLGHDIDNSEPSISSGTQRQTGINGYAADRTGTSQDPKLVVEHEAGATQNSAFFMFM
jgi:hypothetical protein